MNETFQVRPLPPSFGCRVSKKPRSRHPEIPMRQRPPWDGGPYTATSAPSVVKGTEYVDVPIPEPRFQCVSAVVKSTSKGGQPTGDDDENSRKYILFRKPWVVAPWCRPPPTATVRESVVHGPGVERNVVDVKQGQEASKKYRVMYIDTSKTDSPGQDLTCRPIGGLDGSVTCVEDQPSNRYLMQHTAPFSVRKNSMGGFSLE